MFILIITNYFLVRHNEKRINIFKRVFNNLPGEKYIFYLEKPSKTTSN